MRDTRWPGVLVEVREGLQQRRFQPQWLVDAIFQSTRSPSLLDAYGFSLVWSHVLSAEIGFCALQIGTSPSSDEDVEENRQKLARLTPPFEASVDRQRGASADDDGRLSWREPILLGRVDLRGQDEIELPWECPADSIPLEIGTTAVSKTLMHLRGEPGVARWPYGHERIVILKSHPSLHEWLESDMPPWERA